MAKTRRYLLTTGSYDSYRILACVEGAATPALSTLRKQFHDRYGIIETGGSSDYDVMMNSIHSKHNAERQARTDGYEGIGLAEIFLDWIIKKHGFVTVKLDEVWI